MTDATIASRSVGKNDTPALSHTITKPGGLTSSQGILICFTSDTATATATTTSTGWSALATQVQGTTTNHRGTVFWAPDAAAAANLVVDLSASQEATWAIIVVNNPGTPEVAGDNSSGTSITVPPLTFSKSADWLVVLYVGVDSSTTTTQTITWPGSYANANVQAQNPGITSSAATFTSDLALAAVESVTPGTATLGSTEQSVQFTIGFPGLDSSKFFLSAA